MVNKTVLIIGSGAREHAIGWKLKQSPIVSQIFFAPGNGGTSKIGKNVPIDMLNLEKLLVFAKENKIDLTIVGPEGPLELGIVDLFQKNKLAIFGPTKAAAQLETDKAWAANFMKKYKIPHPRSYQFSNIKEAISFFEKNLPSDFVIKAAGLAAGKGVVLPNSKKEAVETIKKIMEEKVFGDAGSTIIIQEKIQGPEVSMLAFSDGKIVLPLLPAQDSKRAFDNNRGPNTGGMGAYAPVSFVDKKLMDQILKTILQPTILGMKKDGNPYSGILYAGLMVTKNGPMVIEYNARFGDPETEPLMLLLSEDLFPFLVNSALGSFNKKSVKFKKGSAVCVVIASSGYPNKYTTGKIIYGLNQKKKNLQIFHAGTKSTKNRIVTSGGRVLGVTSYAKTQNLAAKTAYSVIGKKGIHFANMHYRSDIGK